MPEYQSFVSIDIWTALFCLVNMLITFAILKKFLFKPVLKMISDRQKEIDDTFASADAAKAEAESLRQSYTEKLASANAESEQIVRTATQRAQLKEEEILQEAQAKAAHTMEHAQQQIELEKKQAMHDLKGQVSGIAVDIASAVLGEDVDSKKHENLIDSFIENLGE